MLRGRESNPLPQDYAPFPITRGVGLYHHPPRRMSGV